MELLPVPMEDKTRTNVLVSLEALLTAFLEGRSAQTLRAYAGDLADFANFVGATQNEAARRLLENGHGAANALALSYRAELLRRGLSPATINRRLAALRALVKMGRTLGLVSWTLEAKSVKSQAYRDTKGPGRDGASALLQAAGNETPAKAARDRALVLLMYACALRRAEVVGLDIEHLEAGAGSIWIMGKGRTERERVTLPQVVRAALLDWLPFRAPGSPLFTALDRNALGSRLSGSGVYKIVRTLGHVSGLVVRPHGLRHAGITSALDLGADMRQVQRFSRHRDIRTLQKYDDNRADFGGRVAQLVADQLGTM